MNIYYYNSFGKIAYVEVTNTDNIQTAVHHRKPAIKNMKRKNDAHAEILGVFETEEIRDNEMSAIKEAIEKGCAEYTVQNSKREGVKASDFGIFGKQR